MAEKAAAKRCNRDSAAAAAATQTAVATAIRAPMWIAERMEPDRDRRRQKEIGNETDG